MSGDMLIAPESMCANNQAEIASCRLSYLEQQGEFTIISASYLLSYSIAVKGNSKLRSADILL